VARGPRDWRALWAGRGATLAGGEVLLAGTLLTLLVLDAATRTRASQGAWGWVLSARAGGRRAHTGPARPRWRGSPCCSGHLVVLKGFYVYVWLYTLR
jgi:hypothetical protein